LIVAAVSVAGPGVAWATKLDKAACTDLSTELTAVMATGVKADMERGPGWAKANMPPERLESVRRLLELEDQLEFRCGIRGKGIKAQEQPTPSAAEAPDSKAAEPRPPGADGAPAPTEKRTGTTPAMMAPVFKPLVAMQPSSVAPAAAAPTAAPVKIAPTAPAVVAPAATQAKSVPPTATAVTKPVQPAPVVAVNPPVAPPLATTAPVSAPQPAATPPVTKIGPLPSAAGTAPAAPVAPAAQPARPAPIMAANPPVVAPTAATGPVSVSPAGAPPVTKIGPLPSAAGTAPVPSTAALPTPGGAVPGAKKPGDPAAQAARKKNPRRNPTSAYVSPTEVTPFALPGLGSR
jgi:hypothetical protein